MAAIRVRDSGNFWYNREWMKNQNKTDKPKPAVITREIPEIPPRPKSIPRPIQVRGDKRSLIDDPSECDLTFDTSNWIHHLNKLASRELAFSKKLEDFNACTCLKK